MNEISWIWWIFLLLSIMQYLVHYRYKQPFHYRWNYAFYIYTYIRHTSYLFATSRLPCSSSSGKASTKELSAMLQLRYSAGLAQRNSLQCFSFATAQGSSNGTLCNASTSLQRRARQNELSAMLQLCYSAGLAQRNSLQCSSSAGDAIKVFPSPPKWASDLTVAVNNKAHLPGFAGSPRPEFLLRGSIMQLAVPFLVQNFYTH